MLVSQTSTGLQNAINKMNSFYQSLDLKINIKKTKVIVFNKRGVQLEKKYAYVIDGKKLEITDQYQYLGLKLRPSGSLNFTFQELKAWLVGLGLELVILYFEIIGRKLTRHLGFLTPLLPPSPPMGAHSGYPIFYLKKAIKHLKTF